ncbi:hypothetical protein DM860_014761 [Cuscuta australis]|uniref:Uncharacterized protein n=1 Tax=Cuscuta australis TaxID=267555 RepID=A0A328CZM5_9ASTE|nr:hypothetical protein DM860_014761 [Cuscuta australis]
MGGDGVDYCRLRREGIVTRDGGEMASALLVNVNLRSLPRSASEKGKLFIVTSPTAFAAPYPRNPTLAWPYGLVYTAWPYHLKGFLGRHSSTGAEWDSNSRPLLWKGNSTTS